MPVASFAASDIIVWFHGGSNTNSTSVSAIVGIYSTLLLMSATRIRSEEHTSELQSLMRISCAVFCLKNKRAVQHESRDRGHSRIQFSDQKHKYLSIQEVHIYDT